VTSIYSIAGLLVIIAALSAGLWFSIERGAELRAEVDACAALITISEDFNEGASNPDGNSWLDRLRGVGAAN